MSRCWRTLLVIGLCATVAAGCSGPNPYEAARNAADSTASTVAGQPSANTAAAGTAGTDNAGAGNTGTSVEGNVYLPESRNLSDCIGAVERPDCGSSAKGGWRQYLVLAVLAAGVGFIGWRIARGVRARDAVVNDVQ